LAREIPYQGLTLDSKEYISCMPGAGRRLLIVEDEPLMASLLKDSLSAANFDVQVASDVASGRKAIDRFDPDILLLDISLGDGPSGIHLAHAVHETRPDIAILILTKHANALSATSEGLDLPPGVGFLRKHLVNDLKYLLSAIEKVLSDHPEEVRQDEPVSSPVARLNPQAVKVWALIAQGYNNTEIAVQMNLSVKSVERWIDSIYRELNIESKVKINPRVEAARQYYLIAGISQRKINP
jgi:DNA-binding NarL/FixJ family response regulator